MDSYFRKSSENIVYNLDLGKSVCGLGIRWFGDKLEKNLEIYVDNIHFTDILLIIWEDKK